MAPTAALTRPSPHFAGDAIDDEHYQMALANRGLIGFTIKRFRVRVDSDYTADDAFQDGWGGLVRAAQKFDPDKGFRFATYAIVHIRAAIQQGRGNHSGVNYRRNERTKARHIDEVSLDAEIADGASTYDLVADEADTAAAALDAVMSETLRTRGHLACRDRLDRAIFDLMIDPNEHWYPGSIARELEAEFGASTEAVRRRYVGLLGRLREILSGEVTELPVAN